MHKVKKKIILFSPTIEDGGVEKNLFNIAKYLNTKFDQIIIVTSNTNKKNNFTNDIIFKSPNSNFFINSNRIIKTIISFFLLLQIDFNHKENVILSFNNNIFSIIFAKILKAKIIIRSNTSIKSYCKNKLKRKIFSFFFNMADSIIVNSYEMLDEMENFLNLKAQCIYNPLENIEEILIKSNRKLDREYYPQNVLKIITVGRLVKQKNQILILKALNKIKQKVNFKLLIIGDGEEKKTLSQYIKKNNLDDKIEIICYQNNIYPFIKLADLFILSSNFEGMPNVILEALSLKKIVFSTNCPTGPKEILKNGEFGKLYPVNNYIELSNLIANFNSKKVELDKMTENGFKSLARFNFEKNCEKYYQIINNINEKKN